MNVTFGKYDHIIRARVVFHRGRFNAYIAATGMTNSEGIDHLMSLSKLAGSDQVVAEIDSHVPEEFHSSRMPELGKEVEG